MTQQTTTFIGLIPNREKLLPKWATRYGQQKTHLEYTKWAMELVKGLEPSAY